MAKATFKIGITGLAPVFKQVLGDVGSEMLHRDLNINDSGIQTCTIIQGWGIVKNQYGWEDLVIEVEICNLNTANRSQD